MGRRLVAVVLLVVVALSALAWPLRNQHLAFPSDSTSSSDTTPRKASDLISEEFGPGREAPLKLVVDAKDVAESDRDSTFAEIVSWAEAKDGVLHAQVANINASEDALATGAQILIAPA